MSTTTEPIPDLELRRFNLGLISLGEAISDIGTILQQGLRPDNHGKRAGVAIGLMRAGKSFLNEPWEAPDPLWHRVQKHYVELVAAADGVLARQDEITLKRLKEILDLVADRKVGT